jgi:hypothetical protein
MKISNLYISISLSLPSALADGYDDQKRKPALAKYKK